MTLRETEPPKVGYVYLQLAVALGHGRVLGFALFVRPGLLGREWGAAGRVGLRGCYFFRSLGSVTISRSPGSGLSSNSLWLPLNSYTPGCFSATSRFSARLSIEFFLLEFPVR